MQASHSQSHEIFAGASELEYNQFYREGLYSTLSNLSLLLPLLLCCLPIIYQIFYRLDLKLVPFTKLLWKLFVFLSPLRLLNVVENFWASHSTKNVSTIESNNNRTAKSNIMRRIFSMDRPSNHIDSVVQAGRKISGMNFATQEHDDRPAGLGNWDNSCYQNSILQGLASLKSLYNHLSIPVTEISDYTTKLETDSGLRMVEALRNLLGKLNNQSNNGKRIWTPDTLKNMSSWQQQDAQEYFSKILDEVDREMRTKADYTYEGFKLGPSEITEPRTPLLENFRNPLEGLIAQRVGCTECGYSEGLFLIPFNCLTLPLNQSTTQSISQCLDEYSKLELIEGVNCGKCTLINAQKVLSKFKEGMDNATENSLIREQVEKRLQATTEALESDIYEDKNLQNNCKITNKNWVASTKSRQAVIARPPKSLVIHFNRSLYDDMTGGFKKNCSQVRFPKILDLGPWCLGSAGKGTDILTEEWILEPEEPMIAGSTKHSRQKGPIFELRAVITHYGRHENGHYVCYKIHPPVWNPNNTEKRQQWWRLSDDEVVKVNEEDVLAQGGVFMLFYERIDLPPSATDSFQMSNLGNTKEESSNMKHSTSYSESSILVPIEERTKRNSLELKPTTCLSSDKNLRLGLQEPSSSKTQHNFGNDTGLNQEEHHGKETNPDFKTTKSVAVLQESWDINGIEANRADERNQKDIPTRSFVMV
ncbi:ubiquitin hydrolase [Blumeria hordei DH14]|uniref:ubiquitinyl hydrolase 1 n=1 Tax=Blumeria graminis f. sp. hordei (strain DH14) TaxID=546991 RepID=N1JBE7_BLUG1|nr:ubiquitin hydrolase [Blumeria hordei DH14]